MAAFSIERVGHARPVAEPHQAELLDQFQEGVRARAQVGIDGVPDVVVDRVHDLLGAPCLVHALAVGRFREHLRLEAAAISEMAEILFPLADRVIATRPLNPRAASPAKIQEAAARTGVEVEAVEDVQRAVERARALAGADTLVVITGSIYLVGEVMRIIGAEV